MRLKNVFQLVELGDEYLIVPVGEEAVSFQGVVAINEESAHLIKILENGTSKQELIGALVSEYNVDYDVAEKDVTEFIRVIRELGLLLDT